MKKGLIIGLVCLAAGTGIAGCGASGNTGETSSATATITTETTTPETKISETMATTEAVTTADATEAPTATTATEATVMTTTAAAGYTDQELCDMAQNYYQWTTGYRPPISEVDSVDGDIVTIHLYEIRDGHTATSAWYEIDRTTGKGKNTILEEAVDLTEVLK